LLQVSNPREHIAALHRQRDPLYREIADIIVDGGRSNPASMVRQILKALESCEKWS
jgi:shikimate kinase